MHLRIMVSRHSAFYSPLIATLAAGFLEDAGLSASYSVLGPGQSSYELIRDGEVDIMQSAVSSSWPLLERGVTPLPVHFALINRRDGFYLAGRTNEEAFSWKKLEGRTLLADHGGQPLAMLRYAAHYNGADWSKIAVPDRGGPEQMSAAFRAGEGDYIHLQAPGPQLLEEDGVGRTVVSVGASMPEVAFSTLCCSRRFLETTAWREFLTAYRRAREWVRSASPSEVAEKEADFFPGVSRSALTAAIAGYQNLGTWTGSDRISPALYEQALHVFAYSGGLAARHPLEAVCHTPGDEA
ncbi:MAG: ABC transporter substrate-binding protein [Acidobacteriota bacterium]